MCASLRARQLDAALCTLPSLTGTLKHHSASHTEPISSLENGARQEPGQLCEASTGTLGADDIGEAWIAVPPDLSLSLGLAESGRPSTTPGPLPIDPCQLAERAVSAGTYGTPSAPCACARPCPGSFLYRYYLFTEHLVLKCADMKAFRVQRIHIPDESVDEAADANWLGCGFEPRCVRAQDQLVMYDRPP